MLLCNLHPKINLCQSRANSLEPSDKGVGLIPGTSSVEQVKLLYNSVQVDRCAQGENKERRSSNTNFLLSSVISCDGSQQGCMRGIKVQSLTGCLSLQYAAINKTGLESFLMIFVDLYPTMHIFKSFATGLIISVRPVCATLLFSRNCGYSTSGTTVKWLERNDWNVNLFTASLELFRDALEGNAVKCVWAVCDRNLSSTTILLTSGSSFHLQLFGFWTKMWKQTLVAS